MISYQVWLFCADNTVMNNPTPEQAALHGNIYALTKWMYGKIDQDIPSDVLDALTHLQGVISADLQAKKRGYKPKFAKDLASSPSDQ